MNYESPSASRSDRLSNLRVAARLANFATRLILANRSGEEQIFPPLTSDGLSIDLARTIGQVAICGWEGGHMVYQVQFRAMNAGDIASLRDAGRAKTLTLDMPEGDTIDVKTSGFNLRLGVHETIAQLIGTFGTFGEGVSESMVSAAIVALMVKLFGRRKVTVEEVPLPPVITPLNVVVISDASTNLTVQISGGDRGQVAAVVNALRQHAAAS